MRAEFLKIRSLPTPFWTGVAVLVCFLGGIAATVAWGIGADNAVLDIAIGMPTARIPVNAQGCRNEIIRTSPFCGHSS